MFGKFTTAICEEIERKRISVKRVVNEVRDLPIAFGETDKMFFLEYTGYLRSCGNVASLFDRLKYNWDYLHPEIYKPLISSLSLTCLESRADRYLQELVNFIEFTPLSAYCKIPDIELEKSSEPPPGFVKAVVENDWEPPPMYLIDIEKMRRKLARECNCQSCFVTVIDLKLKCLEITFLVPHSTSLRVTRDHYFIREHSITKISINGIIVYSTVSS